MDKAVAVLAERLRLLGLAVTAAGVVAAAAQVEVLLAIHVRMFLGALAVYMGAVVAVESVHALVTVQMAQFALFGLVALVHFHQLALAILN
jgi:hypothetical protein